MATPYFISEVISAFAESQGIKVLDAEIALEPLKGGSSAAMLYRFSLNSTPYVLRILPTQAQSDTRMHQVLLGKQAGKIGVGPEVYFVDSQMQAFVMEFIEGRTMQRADFENPVHLASFANLLRRLHGSTENFPKAVSPFKRFCDFYKKAEGHSYLPPRFVEVKSLMKALEDMFQRWPIAEVPCHLDLHPLNMMLANERPVLVDWVNGGLSDPYFDLATFSTLLDLTESQIQTFLAYYFDRPPRVHEQDRFTLTKPVRLFVIAAALFSSNIRPAIKGKVEREVAHSGHCMFQKGLEIIDQLEFQTALGRRVVNNIVDG